MEHENCINCGELLEENSLALCTQCISTDRCKRCAKVGRFPANECWDCYKIKEYAKL